MIPPEFQGVALTWEERECFLFKLKSEDLMIAVPLGNLKPWFKLCET